MMTLVTPGPVFRSAGKPRRLLPDDQLRCSAFWYAQHAGLLTGNGDLDFLRCLGWHAAGLARWHGIPEWQVSEGPWRVNMWPEWVWSATADAMAQAAAEQGDYDVAWGGQPPPAGYRAWGDEGWANPYG